MENTPLLSIKNLSIEYLSDGKIISAVNRIHFQIHAKETVGLVGETGAGKTTTALSIMKLIQKPAGKYTSGEIVFNGEDLMQASEQRMRSIRGKQISMISQDPMTSLDPVFTVGEQIAEIVRLHEKVGKVKGDQRAAEVLELVGIPGTRASEYPHQFSGGMRQRVCIAMALAANPQLIIADEPTTALDVTIQAQVLDLIRNLRDEFQTAMILITHDLGIVADVCDKVAIMYAGEIVEFGTLDEIFRQPSHPYTIGLFNAIPKLHEKIHRLQPIKGLMPDPSDLPIGCSFSPRCNYATDICGLQKPQYEVMNENHTISCLRYREVANLSKEGGVD